MISRDKSNNKMQEIYNKEEDYSNKQNKKH